MKHSFNKPLLACASIVLACSFSASAATVVYAPGDLLVGFRLSDNVGQGAGTSYVINIGQASLYRDAGVLGSVPIAGNFTADLSTIFGANWASRSNLMWAIIGTPSNIGSVAGDPAATMYASKVESAPGVAGTAWEIAGSGIRTAVSTTISTFQSGFAAYQATANSGAAVIQLDTESVDWRSFLAGGGDITRSGGNKDFGGFDDLEANVGETLSLFRVAGIGPGSYEGTFAVTSGGITFVPEPTSSAMGALGALVLAFRRRRSA